MRILTKNEYESLEYLLSLTQEKLLTVMTKVLIKTYGKDKVLSTNDYIMVQGEIPVALVAHLDTVFKYPVMDLYYDRTKNVLWSPDGLGTDDRAGVFCIIQLLKEGYRPWIILTTDEECGGLGARILIEEQQAPPVNFLIELDRQGNNECVFYQCGNVDFQNYITSFGFEKSIGTFSDISILMPSWKLCGVNLSIGYYDEHTYTELFNLEAFWNTYDQLKELLQQESFPTFEYISQPLRFTSLYNYLEDDVCDKCHKSCLSEEIFAVKGGDGLTKMYCSNCIASGVDWCATCCEPYEITEENINRPNMCDDCWEAKCGKFECDQTANA